MDPGSHKCGLVLVDLDQGIVLDGKVSPSSGVVDLINDWIQKNLVQEIFLGNGTSSLRWQKLLLDILPLKLVEEQGTTLLARQRYWEIWPPSGWRKYMPRDLVLPPHDLDAIAALLLVETYLQRKFFWPGEPNFKISP